VPNIEKVEGKNSLDDRLLKILKDSSSKSIPVFYGMNKFNLGKASRKKHSCVSILAFINVEGFEREFKTLIEFADEFRKQFYQKFNEQRKSFEENKFINMALFDIYNK
jgi:hypothetical protein